MNPLPSSIVKLGGSLFGVPDLRARLANFLADFGRPRPILVSGGGPLVDCIRRWDRIYDLGEETSHWIALRLLSASSRVLERLLPDLQLVDSPDDCPALWQKGKVPLYDPFHFIADIDEEALDPLPRRWRATSDSIAARMAVTFGAEELVLLKSVSVPERLSRAEAALRGLVDPHFPVAAQGIPRVVAINLRSEEQAECILYEE
jgi:aspartokinase-like uncharacterized kinase